MPTGKERDARDAQPFVRRSGNFNIASQSGSASGNSSDSGCGGCNASGGSDARPYSGRRTVIRPRVR